MADDKAKEVIAAWERMDGERLTSLSHWQQCSNYLHPDRADYITQRSPGAKRMQWVFDSYPIWAREQFSAGCHSFLTSSTLLWFGLVAEDDRINALQPVREWLDAATVSMYAVFNSSRHNFATGSHEVYDDVGTIGTACMGVLEDRHGWPLFSTRHMREICYAENDEDRVDNLTRCWSWTADQATTRWGAKAGDRAVKLMADKKPNEKCWYLHSVKPRRKRDPQRSDNRNMPFESVYVSRDDQTIVSESGFGEFPYVTPRHSKATGETYGRGPGQTVLPDVKMLNEASKLVIKAAQKIIDPPLDLPDDGYIVPIRTVPGSLNFRRPGLRPDDRIQAMRTEGNIPIGNEMLQALRSAIGRPFLVDLLHMPTDPSNPQGDGKGSTATYWMQRREKEMMALSPFLSRMQGEWGGPVIDRTFAIMWRKSVAMRFGPGSPFPPPPAELSGQPLRVDYVSPIAMAQRGSELDGIDRLIARQMQLRQMDPQSPLILDIEETMRTTGRDLNTPSRLLKSVERLQEEAQARAEAEAQMNQHAALQSVAGAAKDGTAALKNMADAQRGAPPANDTQAEAA